jgi:hypothetical protein
MVEIRINRTSNIQQLRLESAGWHAGLVGMAQLLTVKVAAGVLGQFRHASATHFLVF